MKNREQIRNFSIIAHIDHGKSTLADRLLEQCKAVSVREMEEQLLDNMELERERGITIKARAVRMEYTRGRRQDLRNEPDRHPGTCGLQLRGLAVLWRRARVRCWLLTRHRALRRRRSATPISPLTPDLEVVPVINKIDLPAADAPRVKKEIEDIIGIPAEDSPEISAKMNINIHEVLERIVTDVPAPEGDPRMRRCSALDVRQPV